MIKKLNPNNLTLTQQTETINQMIDAIRAICTLILITYEAAEKTPDAKMRFAELMTVIHEASQGEDNNELDL
mgnify:CR=1 FL=1|tara:strand:- start:3548 stop:3763 length:216 start_codon:yes stop_codon:yes gene_type:complete